MATHKMGTIREVSVRELWDHEAHDFTPWLAKHIDLLGEALQMDLERPRTEVPVGPFFLDMEATDGGRSLKVVIENQLEGTDHTHLGQLLTYATHLDASVVVWIAPRFHEEHRAAIDWLNRVSTADVEFFAVEVRAITIEQGDDKKTSLPAPEFRPVAFPNDWTKGNAGKRSASNQTSSPQWLDFFEPLVDKLREAGFTNKTSATKGNVQRFKDECVKGTYYSAWFGWDYAIVSTTMWNKDLYAALEARKGAIAEAITAADIKGELYWRNPKNYEFFEIHVRIKGRISDPPERLEEIRDWMFDSLPKFRKILNPHIKEIVGELEADPPVSAAD